jgi:hypothetical protein
LRENLRAQIVLGYTHLEPRFKANPHNIKRFANLLTPATSGAAKATLLTITRIHYNVSANSIADRLM